MMSDTRMPGSHRNMLKIPKWTYNEMKQTGVDYLSVEQVQRCDDLHQRFRNYEKDGDAIIKRLKLTSKSTVIDMGAGTGAFALQLRNTAEKSTRWTSLPPCWSAAGKRAKGWGFRTFPTATAVS